ncbi:F-box protein At3g07870-like [Papaver somniferum]|uniref:F-box protein At3g07870-like n=1 Tax=Papaver somniferum TaxID=3469 RepID=UPI000E7014DA|nr:F-box protein At3g07870-like [Papaver somniferum]
MGCMDDLPLDISLNIFSRLHVDSVLECKLVCKPWRDLIRNPSFAQDHLAVRKLLLRKLDENYTKDCACETGQPVFLLLAQISDKYHDQTSEFKIKTVKIPLLTQSVDLEDASIHSINGLICSIVYHHKVNDPVHICNPVTREFIYLLRYEAEAYKVLSGFGYSPSTDEYRVLRIYRKGDDAWRLQVYILGKSCKWTEEKEIPYQMFRNVGYYSKGIHANGEIHWLDQASKIIAFSLADEKFHYIASPLHA